jgi:hypothetical protein
VDFRKGAAGLMALVQDSGADQFSGALYVFRSTMVLAARAETAKLLAAKADPEARIDVRMPCSRRWSGRDMAAIGDA